MIGINFEPDAPRANYYRGWGHEMLKQYPIICSWTIIIQDIDNKPVALTFDLTNDDAPLTVGLDVQQYLQRDFTKRDAYITILRPQDVSSRSLLIHTQDEGLKKRAHIDLIGLKQESSSLAATSFAINARPITLAKRIHRYTHGSKEEMIGMLERMGYDHYIAENICTKIVEKCSVCQQSETQLHLRKYHYLMYVKHLTMKFKLTLCSQLFVQRSIVFYMSLMQGQLIWRPQSRANAQWNTWLFY